MSCIKKATHSRGSQGKPYNCHQAAATNHGCSQKACAPNSTDFVPTFMTHFLTSESNPLCTHPAAYIGKIASRCTSHTAYRYPSPQPRAQTVRHASALSSSTADTAQYL